MRIFGKPARVIWWWQQPRFTTWRLPANTDQRFWNCYHFGIVEIRIKKEVAQ